MREKPINLGKAREAMDDIRGVLHDDPEIADRTAAFLSGTLEGNEDMPSQLISIRLSDTILERIDALIPSVEDLPELAVLETITRTHVLRLALLKGLDALEEEVIEEE